MTIQPLNRPSSVDWDKVAQDLAPIAVETRENARRRKSRDYYWFSPILKPALEELLADVVVQPQSVEEVETVVSYCVANALPLTVRGGGTGNYGQAMPLLGGIVLDLTKLNALLWIKDGIYRAQAGIKMFDLEKLVNDEGFEQRFFPSTWRSATLGGFIAGGTSGCGAIRYGTLHTPGNVLALKVLTAEETPRIVELRGADAQAVVHAYGTNGIILEAELALTPLMDWHDRMVAFDDLPSALAFTSELAHAETIEKKQLALLGQHTVAAVPPVAALAPEGKPVVLAMIAADSLGAFDALCAKYDANVFFERKPGEFVKGVPALYEMCWNHTTLHAIGKDPEITYLQSSFGNDWVEQAAATDALIGEESPLHLEIAKIDGHVVCFGINLLHFKSPERLEEVHQVLRDHGASIFNPHTHFLENGGLQIADPQQFEFRKTSDPQGLFNPGKMPGWDAPAKG